MGPKIGRKPAWIALALTGAWLWCCAPASGQTTGKAPPPRTTPGEAAFIANTAPSLFVPPIPAATTLPGLIPDSRSVADKLPAYSLFHPYIGPDQRALEQQSKSIEFILSFGAQMLHPADDLVRQIMAATDTSQSLDLQLPRRPGAPTYVLGFDLPVNDPLSFDAQMWIHDIYIDPMGPDSLSEMWVGVMLVIALVVIFMAYRLVLRGRRGLPQEWEY